MLMAAALHMMDSAHGHGPTPSSYTSPPPPWLSVLADDDSTHRCDQLLICDLAASAAPPNHQSLRPVAARRVANKRRPRPSRKVPTTYIAADPASFRRMVQQVTGADDVPVPLPPGTLCRPAPSRAAAGALTLPTLDTSAFLLAGAAPRSRAEASAGFAAAPVMLQGKTGGDYSSSSFPTLDSSWDDHPLF